MSKVVPCAFVLWAGIVLGVSFIATPAKFLAESLTLAVALDVGKETFTLFNKIEWVLFAAIVLFAVCTGTSKACTVALAVVFTILCVETFVLLPELSLRASSIMSGQKVSSSLLHSLYVGIEIMKLAILGVVGVCSVVKN